MKTLVRNNFVMIKKIVEQAQTKGGLLLSEGDRKETGIIKGEVIDLGDKTTGTTQLGDIAFFEERYSAGVDVDGEIFTIIMEHHILLIQREDE